MLNGSFMTVVQDIDILRSRYRDDVDDYSEIFEIFESEYGWITWNCTPFLLAET